jgi:ribosomal protein S18 acetylase RimI-like enzyme
VIHYRTFRNTDPPALAEVWNNCFDERGAAPIRSPLVLEYFVFAKPYFDPQGLIVALEDERPVGFVLTGPGSTADQRGVDHSIGVICVLGVLKAFRGQGIGSQLLSRGEEYLRAKGATTVFAGPQTPHNPFTFALYGGSQSPGFLDSTVDARPFLERRGYVAESTHRVLHFGLDRPPNVPDGRFVAYRQRYEIMLAPRHGTPWYTEGVLGPIELHDYHLRDKVTGRNIANAGVWEMDTFGQRWNEHAIGLTDFQVGPDLRRQGFGKFLLAMMLRHLHEQFFTIVEAQVPADMVPAVGLFQRVGFTQVDVGRRYRNTKP